MPLRRYACSQCGRQYQLEQRAGEPPYTSCPVCHSETLYGTPDPVDVSTGSPQSVIWDTSKKR